MDRSVIERVVKQTKYVKNPFFIKNGIHPELTPEEYAPTLTPSEAVDYFADKVAQTDHAEYGDFMRAVNAEIEHLREKIGAMSHSISRRLDQMQRYTQFLPRSNSSETKERLLYDASVLKKWIEKLQAGFGKGLQVLQLQSKNHLGSAGFIPSKAS